MSKIGATLPIIVTPAGQGLALGFAAEGLSQAIAVVTATRAQLLGPTTHMTTNGVKIKVTNVPGIKGINPFSVAGSVVDTVTLVVGAVRQLPTQLAPPVTPDSHEYGSHRNTCAGGHGAHDHQRAGAGAEDRSAVRTAWRTGFRRRVRTAMPEPPLTGSPRRRPWPEPTGCRPPPPNPATATPVARNPAGGNGYGAGAPMVAAPAGGGPRWGEGTGRRRHLVSEDNGVVSSVRRIDRSGRFRCGRRPRQCRTSTVPHNKRRPISPSG